MQITVFKNGRGLIHGSDPKRIRADCPGILRIGKTEIEVEAQADLIMPMLFYGATGDYPASFTSQDGRRYQLEPVCVRGGWIQPPLPIAVEIMELRVLAEEAAARLDTLEHLFDTNALNFLIK